MAENKINATVSIKEDGSLGDLEKKANRVSKALDSLDRKKNTSRTGSKAADAALSSTEDEGQAYRNARAGRGTGAAGRDFAKQAQGLGGLVHVYATFAANIFAVAAAFSALDKAYSVLRLEQSAKIMSGTLGFSVNALSQDLVKATGHAIAFQEAMQFADMGLAAGLTAKQITSLTVIAKGAANALGRDMGDAVRRMIQGTAKQEQEILDELGIFVRAKTAYAEFAKDLGLSGADALTAAQRVQAYANAVEASGQKWIEFSKIDDPFSKFTSGLKEAGADILNTLNSFIAPVLSFLAQSKQSISGLILTVTSLLLSKAMPHLRESLTGAFMVDKEKLRENQESTREYLIHSGERTIAEIRVRQEKVAGDLYSKVRPKMLASNLQGVNMESMAGVQKAIDTTIKQQIKLGSEANRQVQLQQAIKQGLVSQESTLDHIIVLESARFKIANDIMANQALTVELEMARAKILSISEKEETAIAAAKRIQNLQAKAALLTAQETLGLQFTKASGAKDLFSVLMGLPLLFNTAMATTVGFWNRSMLVMKLSATALIGTVSKLFGPLMTLYIAWDLLVVPLAKSLGIISERNEKIAESAKALKEGAEAAATQVAKLTDALNAGVTGEDLTKIYSQRATSLSAAAESINKLIAEYRSKPIISAETGEDLTESNKYLIGAGGRSREKSAGLKMLEAQTSGASLEERSTEAYKEVYKVKELMVSLETEYIDKKITSVEYEQKHVELLEKGEAALLGYVKLEQQRLSAISKILDPSKAAGKAYDDFIKKHREVTDEQLTKIGLLDINIQKAYKGEIDALHQLNEEKSKTIKVSTSKDLLANFGETLAKAKIEGDAFTKKMAEMKTQIAIIASMDKDNPIAKLALSRAIKMQEDAALLIQSQHVLPKTRAEREKTQLDYTKELLKLEELRTKEKARYVGYEDAESLNKIKALSTEVIKAEFNRDSVGKTGNELGLVTLIKNIRLEELKVLMRVREERNEVLKFEKETILLLQRKLELSKVEYKMGKVGTTDRRGDLNEGIRIRAEELSYEQARIEDKYKGKLSPEQIKGRTSEIEALKHKKDLAAAGDLVAAAELNYTLGVEATNKALEATNILQTQLLARDVFISEAQLVGLNYGELRLKQYNTSVALIEESRTKEEKLLETAVLRAKYEEDITEYKRKQLEIALKTPLSDFVAGKGPDFTDTLGEGLREDIRKDRVAETGIIEGTLKAFDSGVESSMSMLLDSFQTGASMTANEITKAFGNAASDIFKQLALEQAKLAVKQGVSFIGSLFANGGVMSSSGSLPLNKYATGGVADSPQLALYGEGRMNEAYVPLPDGRSIPVTMKSPTTGTGGDNISVNVIVNTTTGDTSTSSSGGGNKGDQMTQLGKLISMKVKEEILNQKRPNGLLAG